MLQNQGFNHSISQSLTVGSYPSFVHPALAPLLGKVWNHPTDPPLVSFALECGLPETSNYLTPSPTVWSSVWMSCTQTFSPLPFSSLLFLYHGQALPFLTPTFQSLDGLLDQDWLQFLESVSCLPTQVNFWLIDPRWGRPYSVPMVPALDLAL